MNESVIIQKLIQVGQMLERGELEYSGAEADTKHYLEKYIALQQTAVSRSFDFGECVKVLHCFHGHEFEIGETVCIVGKSDYDDAWLCRNAKGVEWYMHDSEGEVVNCG